MDKNKKKKNSNFNPKIKRKMIIYKPKIIIIHNNKKI